ncbi:MAG: MFS transporter [Anaerolineae bacterium]|nr:MFS transporter [Anaerolineae bacterium]
MLKEYLVLLQRNRDYRHLWLAALVSYLGDWFNLLAAAALIARLDGTGKSFSFLLLARFLPLFLFTPVSGVLADRFDRRHLMIVSDILRAVTVLGFLLVRDSGMIWLFYLLTVVQFALSALFTPARTSVLAKVVAPKDLVAANGLDGLTWSTMLFVGALLGGLATAAFGITTAFILDALTFVLSAWFVTRISIAGGRQRQDVSGMEVGRLRFVDGLRYLWGVPVLLVLALVKAAGSLVYGAINVLEIPLAEQLFPLGDTGTVTLSIIYASAGLGTGFGPLLVRHWLGDSYARSLWAISLGFGLLVLGIFGLGAAPSVGVVWLMTLIRTFGSGTIWVFTGALLQRMVPDGVRGRVFAFEFAALTLTQSISTLWAGVAQDDLGWGVQQTITNMGAAAAVIALLWFVFHGAVWMRPHLLREP